MAVCSCAAQTHAVQPNSVQTLKSLFLIPVEISQFPKIPNIWSEWKCNMTHKAYRRFNFGWTLQPRKHVVLMIHTILLLFWLRDPSQQKLLKCDNLRATSGDLKGENWILGGLKVLKVNSTKSLHGCERLVLYSDQQGATLCLCCGENVKRVRRQSAEKTTHWKGLGKTGSHRRLSPAVSSLSYCGSCSLAGGRDLFVLEEGWKVKGHRGEEG